MKIASFKKQAWSHSPLRPWLLRPWSLSPLFRRLTQAQAWLRHCVWLGVLAGFGAANAQALLSESLSGTSAALNWSVFGGACLTAGDNTGPIPACAAGTTGGLNGNTPDIPGQGALRLTPLTNHAAGAVVLQNTFDSTAGVDITFSGYAYGGLPFAGSPGGDGIAFMLLDGTVPLPATAGWSGSGLGYSQIAGGYVGVGLDEFGNFATYNAGSGGSSTRYANVVAVRGKTALGQPFIAANTPGTVVLSSTSPTTTTRQQLIDQGLSHNYRVTLTSTGILSLYVDGVAQISGVNVFSAAGAPPPLLRLGFSASTGSAYNIHEINFADIRILDVPALSVAKSVSANPLRVGASGQFYTFTISNTSRSATDGTLPIALADSLPAGVTLAGPPSIDPSSTGAAGATLSGCNGAGGLNLGASCQINNAVFSNGQTIVIKVPVDVAVNAVGANGGGNTVSIYGGGDPACVSYSPCRSTNSVPVAYVNPVAEQGAVTYNLSSATEAIANVRSNDTVTGVTATSANSTLAQISSSNPGITLNTSTGAVSVAANTAPGSYTLTYELCDTFSPAECKQVTDTITVSANVLARTESGTGAAGVASSPIANVRSNDTVSSVTATAANGTIAPSGTWPAGFSLDAATGAISITTAVQPGVYNVAYTLCDAANPGDCSTVTDTITVTANIQPVAETGVGNSANASTPIANVLSNDLVNGLTPTLGAGGNATIATVGTWPAGVALDTATGAVSILAGTPPGTYNLQYQLCDRYSPANCATATDTLTVNAVITPVTESGTATSGTASTPIANVRDNDSVNGAPADSVNSTIATSGTWPTGITLDATTGAVSVAATVQPGTYNVVYQLCDKISALSGPHCKTVDDTITVSASIIPVTETGTATSGTASTAITNVRANDTVNGVAATSTNSTVAQSGTWPTGITLNTTTGAVNVAATVPPGTYSVTYQLCDVNTPANCNTVADTITVGASIIPVTETGTATSGTASTAITNVRANDTVNGVAATSTNSTVAQSGTWPTGITLNTTTGAVNVAATVPPGTYSVTYQLCDVNTPANCKTADITVTVTGAPAVEITKSVSPSTGVKVGDIVTYTITVRSTGNMAADGTLVEDTLPTGLADASWTCVASGGALCPVASGTGSFAHRIATLPVKAQLVYTLTAVLDAKGTVTNTASATPLDERGGTGTTVTATATVSTGEIAPIPTLEQWALALLALMMMAATAVAVNKRS